MFYIEEVKLKFITSDIKLVSYSSTREFVFYIYANNFPSSEIINISV